MKRTLLLLVALLIYGSLFPWHFGPRDLPEGPLRFLLSRWDLPNNSYLPHDIAINIALYVPLGFAAHFAFKRHSLFGPVVLAAGLSTVLEFLQIYDPPRLASMVDILSNVAGTVLGAALGVCARGFAFPALSRRVSPWFAWSFAAIVAVYRLFPFAFVPTAQPFSWIPFDRLIRGNEELGLVRLGVETALFAAAILLFRLAGWRHTKAWVVVVAIVVVTEIARIYQPHTNPGITDPLVAALTVLAIPDSPLTDTGRFKRDSAAFGQAQRQDSRREHHRG